jgi:hypothetical protein
MISSMCPYNRKYDVSAAEKNIYRPIMQWEIRLKPEKHGKPHVRFFSPDLTAGMVIHLETAEERHAVI